MRKVFIALAILIPLLLAADVGTRVWAQGQLADYAAAYYPPSGGSDASIKSFPFLGRLALAGTVPKVSLTINDVQTGLVVVSKLTIDLDRVEIDRNTIFSGDVKVKDIGRGRIEALIAGPSLSKALGVDIRFLPGEVEVNKTIAGVKVTAKGQVAIDGNTVIVKPTSVEGVNVPLSQFALRYEIPGVELLPCEATVTLVAEGVALSCAVDDVPAALVQAVQ